jgi:U4/U6.U5 tri-snRNP component SNU23
MSVRRTWDKDYYEKKAKERIEQGDAYESDSDKKKVSKKKKELKEEFLSAEDGAIGPMGSQRAFLKSREHKMDLEQKVGKVEIINPLSSEGNKGAGFWCEVCACLLKDSISYLDHVNGKKRKLLYLI